MNEKKLSSILLIAIFLTLVAILGAQLLPPKHLGLENNLHKNLFLHSEILPDGTPSAEYDDTGHTKWHCNVPQNFTGDYFACSFGMNLSNSPTQGVDLSNFSKLNLKLNYRGSANKIRIAIRNYNTSYSTPEDGNSTKFNSVQIHAHELKQETYFNLTAFSVGEWWLNQYNIPLKNAQPDISNAMVVTIDFAEKLSPGRHEFELEKLEFEGEWVSTEHWYLVILIIWMLGIFIFAIYQLIQLHQQTQHDTRTINELNTSNEQLKLETNKFRKLSTVDPLTQIYNRFGIDQIVASLSGRGHITATTQTGYGLMVIDIDHFKRVNDQRGHDTGDQVLQQIAKVIQEHLRAGDYAGRWGGEEFIVILPDTSQATAMKLAEVMRNAIFNAKYQTEKPLTVSASFGISLQLPQEDFASCFKRADNALYKAKHQGRNCCIYAEAHI